MIIENSETLTVITPEKKQIDVTNANDFGNQLSDAVENGTRFILNLREVTFMDSSGLGKIISALRKCNEKGHTMVICHVSDAVRVLFDMVRLSQIADLYETLADAEKALTE